MKSTPCDGDEGKLNEALQQDLMVPDVLESHGQNGNDQQEEYED